MKISKVWLLPLIALFALTFTPVLAQESLPKGGSGFDEAVELKTGEYSERIVEEDQNEYFLLKDVKPGQRIHMEVFFEDTEDLVGFDYSLKLYDQDRDNFLKEGRKSGSQKLDLYWLPGAPRESNDYYLKMKVGAVYGGDELKFSLNMEKENFFDVGSGQDAGDTYEQAVEVQPGDYTAYFGGNSGGEDDKVDTYELNLDQQEELTVEAVPPSDAGTAITIFNEQRQKVEQVIGDNLGAITTASFASEQGGTYYAKIRTETKDDQELVEYDVSFSKEKVEQEEITDETTDETTETTEEIPEEVKEQLPEDWEEDVPEDVKEEFKDLEGKSSEEIKKELKDQLPENYYNMITGEKNVVQGLKSMVFNFLKKVLMWFAGLVVLIIVIIVIFKKLGGSDSEEEENDAKTEDSNEEIGEENNKDKGPNKSDN